MDIDAEQLIGRDAIVAALPNNPFISYFVPAQTNGFIRDGAVAWDRQWGNSISVMATGEPKAAAQLAMDVASVVGANRFTLPSEVAAELPAETQAGEPNRWVWFFTTQVPNIDGLNPRGRWLSETEWNDVSELLRAGYPTASGWPSKDRPGRRWFGVRDADGVLVACGAANAAAGNSVSLSSICVHPSARRQGLASDMTAWVVADLLKSTCSAVSLGSWADETDTHRMYRRLGFKDVQLMFSGSFA